MPATVRADRSSGARTDAEVVTSSIAKVIEVIAESDKSWDDAAQSAVTEASKTLDDIKEIWVSGMKATIENNRITRYRLTARITFVLKGHG
jgi:dodecin